MLGLGAFDIEEVEVGYLCSWRIGGLVAGNLVLVVSVVVDLELRFAPELDWSGCILVETRGSQGSQGLF